MITSMIKNLQYVPAELYQTTLPAEERRQTSLVTAPPSKLSPELRKNLSSDSKSNNDGDEEGSNSGETKASPARTELARRIHNDAHTFSPHNS